MADQGGGAGSGKFNAPPPPDYMGLANQQADSSRQAVDAQTRANRIDQTNPYGSLTYGPDGSQHFSFTGPMGDMNASLQQQAAQTMGKPLDFSGLPQVGTGEEARKQAIDSAYGEATSRLDPAFAKREDALRAQLVNQGLQPGSEAYNQEMAQLGRDRNDAYGGAMSNAISQGTAAGSALFGQNMAGRQQALQEMLRQRGQAMGELQGMQGFQGMQGYNAAGLAQGPNLLGAAGMQDASAMSRWQAQMQMLSDFIGGGMKLAGTAGSVAALSDERCKMEVERLEEEVVPGVPAATFRYRPEVGLGTKRHVGVVAQDLQRVMPSAVRQRPDGLLEVHPAFAPHPLED